MEIKDIKRILDAISTSNVSEFSYEKGDFKLAIKRQSGQPNDGAGIEGLASYSAPVQGSLPTVGSQVETVSSLTINQEGGSKGNFPNEVKAPIVGTFYLTPAPEAPPYVKVGDRVKEGTVLCIIEAMKLMNEIEAEGSGTIAEILVQNEEPVEYGQLLFRIDPV
jgi:acetyl-CoA carboxylase biotin carboxyl carrier protein